MKFEVELYEIEGLIDISDFLYEAKHIKEDVNIRLKNEVAIIDTDKKELTMKADVEWDELIYAPENLSVGCSAWDIDHTERQVYKETIKLNDEQLKNIVEEFYE